MCRIGFLSAFCAAISLVGCLHVPAPPAPGPEPIWEPAASSSTIVVADDLRARGLYVEPVGTVQQRFFAVRGSELRVGGEPVELFEYAAVALRARASADIAPDASTIAGACVRWPDTPHIWAAGRLIVVYAGRTHKLVAALDRLFGAPIAQGPAGARCCCR